jgi:hypothetical protein
MQNNGGRMRKEDGEMTTKEKLEKTKHDDHGDTG